jgi:MerR family mercuric resistance operon transcriptional regulator
LSASIGLAADQSGVSIETIRYYERIGLVPKPRRTSGGRRVYAEDDVRRLAFIRRARALGFSLDEVRGLLALATSPDACPEVRELTMAHLARVRARIEELRRLERSLEARVAACADGGRAGCPIIEALAGPAEHPGAAPRPFNPAG